MGPAVLITLGLLFLLANSPGYPFERTWPVLLIVIGAIKVVRYVMPDDSHWNPEQYGSPYPGPYSTPGNYPPQQAAPQARSAQDGAQSGDPVMITPPPEASAARDDGEGNNEVHNG